MTIPARVDEMAPRADDETGPALWSPTAIALRYTARTKSIAWKQDAATQACVESPGRRCWPVRLPAFYAALQPGMGLICNNVLHTRAGFTDRPEHRRLLYRARYHDHLRTCAVDQS
jgi:hypothetical protein